MGNKIVSNTNHTGFQVCDAFVLKLFLIPIVFDGGTKITTDGKIYLESVFLKSRKYYFGKLLYCFPPKFLHQKYLKVKQEVHLV